MTTSSQPLAGKVAIVTGAGRGAGASAALALAKLGASVCASDLNPDRAERTAQELIAAGGTAFGWQADISNRFQVAGLIETTRDCYGRLDIFAQHAHISPRHDALAIDEWEWRRTLEVNLTGSFFCMQLAARVMADEGGGVIALLLRPVEPGAGAAFVASRAGAAALAGALSAEWSGKGIRVEVVDASSAGDAARCLVDLCQMG